MSLFLWRQALSGDPDGARGALEQIKGQELPVLAADLQARLHVRAGRLAEARIIWQAIYKADPNYVPAIKALNKLNSPWLIRAVVKKYSCWFGIGCLFVFGLYGLGTFFVGDKNPYFALIGAATILLVLALYLAGLLAWAYTTAASLSEFGQNNYRRPT
ncbi:hypothetical protein N9Z53_00105 [Mariniblastus sp.]|nr:hypothetical protein [Mariniblastus sp.]